MFFLAALAMLQSPYDPEIEALMRRRDEKKAAEAAQRIVPPPGNDGTALATVIPPEIADRLATCLASANSEAAAGLSAADAWLTEGGGAYAAQCKGYALGKAARWKEAADIFETGAATPKLDGATSARLWSQAGNAALVSGDAARAAHDLDQALAQPLPRTLSTGEIYLDRARARVATNNLPGARADLNIAVQYANADPLAWLLSATLARRMNDLPLARIHIEEAAKRARNDGAIALEQGIIYALSGGRDDAARAAFKRAQEVASRESDTAKQAADYLAQLGPDPAKPVGR